MVCYKCDTCMFSSKIKTHYNRHLKTNKHITNVGNSLIPMVKTQKDPEKTQKDPPFFCDYCNLNFSSYPHKRRHELHRCKDNSSIKDQKINKLEKEKKKLETKIEKMMNKMCTINNTTNNNTQNIVIVNNYGKENTDYLTAEKIAKLLDRPYDSIQDLIKMLHFNADHPENHNVKITNKKEQFALVWNDPIWELRKKKSVVKDMVDKGYMMIDTTHDEVSYDTNKTNKKYVKFQDNYEDDSTNIKDKIEEEAEIVIFNESKKIEN